MNDATPLSSRSVPHQATTTFSPTVAAKRRWRTRWFYTGMGIATILVVMAGFWRSFYGTVAGTAPLTLLVNLHAAAFGAWLILFVAQTTLVATRRTAIHGRLGWAAGVLALLMTFAGRFIPPMLSSL